MKREDAPQTHLIDMSQIKKDGKCSLPRAPVDYNKILDQVHEKCRNDVTQGGDGKTHGDRDSGSDTESFMEKWLRPMSIMNGFPFHNHLIRLLTAIGVNEFEDLEALAPSFKEIVAMIGNEYNAITLMKLRNALWNSTS